MSGSYKMPIDGAIDSRVLEVAVFVPEGYLSVAEAIKRLTVDEEFWSALKVPVVLGVALASKKIRCFGIVVRDGNLIEIPNNYWLTSEGQEVILAEREFITRIDGRRTYDIFPAIVERDLGAEFPKSVDQDARLPVIWPDDYEVQALNPGGQTGVAPTSNPGGRPQKHDWDAFWVEVVHFVELNGSALDARTDCQKHMEEWTATKWADPPAQSAIRGKLAKVFVAPVIAKK